ncbi:MAG: prephenate dehydrogenase/arogenate dehydrogenase family protein [Deltaproteobacteria bacterium]|nr:prephenate dehydrogenase/arogenate dehydrogenase family protein [Deltaproteobacteria bacterium]
MTEPPFTIGIVGGTGLMGQWFADFFQKQGYSVLVAGRRTQLTPAELARQSRVVILSLPREAAVTAARTLGPLLSPDKLLMDLCSLKADICRAMEQSTEAEVVGCHPLFGPHPESARGQNVVLCLMRGQAWAAWLKQTLEQAGALVSVLSPEEHDRRMALAQGLNHFITIALGRTLATMGLTPEDLLPFSTPLFRLKLCLVGRLFAQDVGMFHDIISQNPHSKETLLSFLETGAEMADLLVDQPRERASQVLGEVKDFLGEFCAEGKKRTDAVLATLDQKDF